MLANFFTFLHSTTNFDKHFLAYMIFLVLSSYKRKGVQKMRSNKVTAEKCGTITVSVYKNAGKSVLCAAFHAIFAYIIKHLSAFVNRFNYIFRVFYNIFVVFV